MLKGSIVTFLVEIKCCKAILLLPSGDQMMYDSILTFLVEIKCCKALL